MSIELFNVSKKIMSDTNIKNFIKKYNIAQYSKEKEDKIDGLDIHSFLYDVFINEYMLKRLHAFNAIADSKKWNIEKYKLELMAFLKKEEKHNIGELCKDIVLLSDTMMKYLNEIKSDDITRHMINFITEFKNDVVSLTENLFEPNYSPQIVSSIKGICSKYMTKKNDHEKMAEKINTRMPKTPTHNITKKISLNTK